MPGTHDLIESADFWAFAPVKQTSSQFCVNIEASHPFKKIQDSIGNQALRFKLVTIPPYGSLVITITADIRLNENNADTEIISNPSSFLRPETGIESDHIAIIEQSKKLTTDTQLSTVHQIYNWVSEHIRYSGYSGASKGALFAFHRKKGDCTEYASLFTALCRAANIPARVVGGYICSQDSVLKPSDYHNWSEFHIEENWRIADPQKKNFLKEDSSYIATRIHSNSFEHPFPVFERFQVSNNALRVKMAH